MNTLLKAFKDQADAHAELERVLASGEHPLACCREDPNVDLPYQVWDSGPPSHVLDDLADRIVARLTKSKEQ